MRGRARVSSVPRLRLVAACVTLSTVSWGASAFAALPDTSDPSLQLDRTIETITSIARTGTEGCIGDGKIFVLPTLEAITIDNGQRGPGAV